MNQDSLSIDKLVLFNLKISLKITTINLTKRRTKTQKIHSTVPQIRAEYQQSQKESKKQRKDRRNHSFQFRRTETGEKGLIRTNNISNIKRTITLSVESVLTQIAALVV